MFAFENFFFIMIVSEISGGGCRGLLQPAAILHMHIFPTRLATLVCIGWLWLQQAAILINFVVCLLEASRTADRAGERLINQKQD
ncbi:hypothetical protein FOCC_FOCC011583 [Frankliniella occidentalis]|nr:hypothetical protein FOCC_FOCC011583 [Frankliniella occidentalis]